MNCKICEKVVSKYKCPKCQIPYCSVGCWKIHKDENCQPLMKASEEEHAQLNDVATRDEYRYPTEDTVPIETLKLLGKSKGVLEVLNNPHVQNILTTINKSPNPGAAIHAAMLEPIFVEFADECFQIIDPDRTSTAPQLL